MVRDLPALQFPHIDLLSGCAAAGADLPSPGGAPGQFTWCDGPLLSALRAGHWVLLDELNLAGQAILEGLNAVLDHRAEVRPGTCMRRWRPLLQPHAMYECGRLLHYHVPCGLSARWCHITGNYITS